MWTLGKPSSCAAFSLLESCLVLLILSGLLLLGGTSSRQDWSQLAEQAALSRLETAYEQAHAYSLAHQTKVILQIDDSTKTVRLDYGPHQGSRIINYPRSVRLQINHSQRRVVIRSGLIAEPVSIYWTGPYLKRIITLQMKWGRLKNAPQ
ncbi:hypothetical protein [Lapidilactobacillus luobeiensis]|uniref:hypothetical protein n=1 Tax=Lapidilactobacillus luobeiensis TaxID=2950371 RepID=UPI0021C36067|nr:hypothetical protein [Lapidilactobacillus luobeiensis]